MTRMGCRTNAHVSALRGGCECGYYTANQWVELTQYAVGVEFPIESLWHGSKGEWTFFPDLTSPATVLRCRRCGTERRLPAEPRPMFLARCVCDQSAVEAEWRAHFGVLCEAWGHAVETP